MFPELDKTTATAREIKRANVRAVSMELNSLDFIAFLLFVSFQRSGTYGLGIGRSPLAPNWVTNIPAVERFKYHVPLDGLKTAVSAFPSPS
jgi:hypothetical protein